MVYVERWREVAGAQCNESVKKRKKRAQARNRERDETRWSVEARRRELR